MFCFEKGTLKSKVHTVVSSIKVLVDVSGIKGIMD